MDIAGLKKTLDKHPKSLLFARLSDALRLAAGAGQKNEALAVVNKGLGINSSFLPGKLARGRILFENGDFAGAKADFEAIAEQDPFCLSAQKLLLETLAVLEQQPKTGIYTKILNTIEPNVKIETNVQEIRKAVSDTSAEPALDKSVFDALDSILEEENSNNETEISNLLLQTFENIFGKILAKKPVDEPKAKSSAPVAVPAVAPIPAPVASALPAEKATVEELAVDATATKKSPDLTSELDSLLTDEDSPPSASVAPSAADSPAEKTAVEESPDLTSELDSLPAEDSLPAASVPPASDTIVETPAEKSVPSIEELAAEQLTPKVENLPDLTSELDSLLTDEDSSPAAVPPASDAIVEAPAEKSVPSIEELAAEQLTPKVENLPDLTSELDSLLTAEDSQPAASVPPASDTIVEAPAEKAAPNLDALIAEQLADKAENLPNLTGDMDSLLAAGLPPEKDSAPPAEKAAPNLDDLIAEQLADKAENLPDLTGDMDSLLAAGLPPEKDSSPPAEKPAPNLDALIAEQLADKAENLPDLTGDMDSLLAAGLPPEKDSALPAEKAAPNLDALIAEQLADKAENLPDLTGDMDSLLAAGLPPEKDSSPPAEKAAPNLDDLIAEQLADKAENLPDLTSDMDSLLQEADNDILAQNPTPTLAELYISQGLPQKAAAVYKELLARNPGNIELQARLALAEAQL